MENIPPVSPAGSLNGDPYEAGLRHLAQYNAMTPASMTEAGLVVPSQPGSRFGTPVSMGMGYDRLSAYPQPPEAPSPYPAATYPGSGSPYGSPPDMSVAPYSYGTPPTTDSPTPSSLGGNSMTTWQAPATVPQTRVLTRSSRVEKSSVTVSSAKRGRKDRPKAPKKVPQLTRPLSELTRDWTHVPIEDIEAYVNRSTEERLREVREGKHPGKIKRPMNAFMLYRKAYQARTKDWCLHNNHQVVSQVCGDSWPLEPPELRERFIEWARIERENHQRAHPGYKFTPSKPKNRASSEDLQDDMSEPSDLDDPEWRAGGGSCKHGGAAVRRSKRTGNGRGTYQNMYDLYPSDAPTAAASRVPTPSPAEYHQQYGPQQRHDMDGGTGMRVDSTFVASNPGKPLPPPYEPHALGGGEYYRQSVRPGSSGGSLGVQDVILQKTQVPGGRGYDLDILGRVVAGGSPEGGAGAIELGVVDSHQLATLYQQPNYHGSHGQQEQSIYPSPMDANASIVDPELHVQQAQLMRQQQTPRMLTRAQIQRAHVQAQQNARVALQLQEQQQLHGLSSADQHALIQHLQRHPEQHQLQLVPQHLQRQVDQHLAALTPVDPNVPSAVYDEYDGGTVGGDLSGLDGYAFHDEGTHQSQEDVSHHQSNEWWAPLELVSPSQLFGQSSGLDGHQSHHINDPNGANIPVDDALLALGTGIPASATSVARTETEGSGAAIAVASHLPDLSCAHRMSLAGTDDSWHVIGDPLRGDIASSGGCMAVNEQGEILPLSPPGVPDVGTAANGGEHGDQDPAAGTQFDNLLTPPEENQRDQGKGQEQAEEQLRGLPAADEHGIDAAMKADVSEQQ